MTKPPKRPRDPAQLDIVALVEAVDAKPGKRGPYKKNAG
jgi:hypothetical protein